MAAVLFIRALYSNITGYLYLWNHVLRKPVPHYIDDLHLSKTECLEDFKEITSLVGEHYREMALHKHLNLDSLAGVYRTRLEAISDPREYAVVLSGYFSSLQNMHTFAYFERYQNNDVSTVSRNDTVWVVRSRPEVGLQQRDRIVAVDGLPTADFIRKESALVPGSIPEFRQRLAANGILSSLTDTVRSLTIQRGDSVFEVSLPMTRKRKPSVPKSAQDRLQKNKPQENDTLDYVAVLRRRDQIGCIEIPDFENGSVERFMPQLDSARSCPHLILDLRNNSGGKRGYVMEIGSRLTARVVKMGSITIIPDSARYVGKIYVLVNGMTASGGEFLTGILQGQPHVTVIGQRTAGDCDSSGYNYRTSHGVEFKLATQAPYLLPDGVTYSEGVGIRPDIELPETLPWEKKHGALFMALKLILEDKLASAGLSPADSVALNR